MHSITSLLHTLKTAYPQFAFLSDNQAHWEPESQTIYYGDTDNAVPELLHELSHALLGHKAYKRDIELLSIERDAWELAQRLAPTYDIEIDKNAIEDALDSYRDWLHQRSLCPECSSTGIQSTRNSYRCLACRTMWRVNEAKTCALRRHKINPQ